MIRTRTGKRGWAEAVEGGGHRSILPHTRDQRRYGRDACGRLSLSGRLFVQVPLLF